MKITYICPQCEGEVQIDVSPIIPAKTWGPPEYCYPAEGGEYDVEECPHCQNPVDADQVYKKLEEEIIARQELAADAAYDREKDRRLGL